MKTKSVDNRLVAVLNWIVGSLLLAVLAIVFLYLFDLRRDAGVLADELGEVPSLRLEGRNIERWHDSSLIFIAVDDFRSANGRLPESLGDLFDSQDNALELSFYRDYRDDYPQQISIQGSTSLFNTGFTDLPDEEQLHLWPGFVCAEDRRDDYQQLADDLTYSWILGDGGDGSDFAIVYGAEGYGETRTVKCLDSLGGTDTPDFIFKRFIERP